MKNPIIAVITGLLLSSCAAAPSAENRWPASFTPQEESENSSSDTSATAGREPASMTGNQQWLNEVQDDFSRIADETSSRSVASRRPENLVEHARWIFSYQPANNQFTLKLDGKNYAMVQTSLDDQNSFSFAAEGQTETPITLTLARNEGRVVAQAASSCEVEVSFWDTKAKKYQKDQTNVQGARCDKAIEQLRSYVP